MKPCKTCLEEKSLSEFFKDKGLLDGHSNTCKICKQKKTYAWREKNQDKYNKYMRQKNKEAYPEARFRRYGVDKAWYDSTLKNQDHKCAICRKTNPSSKRTLALDHCPLTGKPRGILCYGCNRLMHLLDNPELYAAALAYKKAS